MPTASFKRRIGLSLGVALVALTILLACRPRAPKPLEEYAVRHIGFWKGERPDLIDGEFRFSTPSKALIEYLVRVNSDDGVTATPSSEGVAVEDLSRLKAMVSALPSSLKSVLSSEVLNISVVSGLGSSAFSSSVFGSDGKVVGGFVVIDRSVLNQSPNEWFTWRENSPFDCNLRGSDKIRATISNGDADDGLRYIFLHEAAHVYAFRRSFHPQWFETPNLKRISETTFAPFSWTVSNNTYQEVFKDTPSLLKGVHYYARPENRLPCNEASKVYKELNVTNFPALYASVDPIEDFGESFANFVHVSILKRPFSVEFIGGDLKTELLGSCWSQKRCADKYQFFSRLFSVAKSRP